MPALAEASLKPVPEKPFVWTREQAERLYHLPFADLLYEAQTIHRRNFDPNSVECAQLLSIKTGGCAEDCSYCSQSAHYKTGVKATKLMGHEETLEAARRAKANGATRFCMGAAWRSLKDRDVEKITTLIADVKALGLETCVTLGMVTQDQAHALKEAGLDYYNHNLDTSPGFYKKIISTRRYEDRLDTLEAVREAGLKTCCGGIIGLGETVEDRLDMLVELANLPEQPHSTPINAFIPAKGTPLQDQGPVDPVSFVRILAVARLMLPKTVLRLSAGREYMSKEMQALCFLAGAGSIFVGDKLLTADNPEPSDDADLLKSLGMRPAVSRESEGKEALA